MEKKMSTPIEVLCKQFPCMRPYCCCLPSLWAAAESLQTRAAASLHVRVLWIVLHVLAVEFITYLNYCRSLRFEDRPDYSYLRRLFKDLFFREGYQYDFIFDWTFVSRISVNSEKQTLMQWHFRILRAAKCNGQLFSGSVGGETQRQKADFCSPFRREHWQVQTGYYPRPAQGYAGSDSVCLCSSIS